ncbi:MAG: response regulator [Spirochaetaceae bacterium]
MKERNERKVAVIDDERHVLFMLEEMFEDNGFSVDAFEKPEEFLANVAGNMYEVIILDYNMPSMTGEEVVAQLLEKEVMRTTPVILISGFLEDTIELPPREEGRYLAIEYMKKPAKLQWMIETVHNLAALRHWFLRAQQGE